MGGGVPGAAAVWVAHTLPRPHAPASLQPSPIVGRDFLRLYTHSG
jgi:hypothetical protein